MKKYLALSIAALALLTVSCKKEVAPEVNVTPEQNEAPATVTRTFSVSAPIDTKTGLGEGKNVIWSAEDKILVIAKTSGNTAEFTIDSGVGSANATFKGELNANDAAETEFYAVYPANLYAAPDANPTTVEFSKPYDDEAQPLLAVAGGFDPKFANMTAVLEGGKFTFRHASAYFKITIAQAGIKSIKISSDGAARIYGRQVVTLASGAVGTVNGSKSDLNFITLAPSEGNFVNGGVYYIPFSVKSGSSFGNVTITATNSSDVECSLTTTSLASKKPAAGLVYDFKSPVFDFSTEPVLNLVKTFVSVGADGVSNGSAEGAYTLKNCTENDITITVDGTVVVAASIAGGTVTYSVEPNTGAAREGWIGLQVPGGAVQKITVSQSAPGVKEHHLWKFSDTGWDSQFSAASSAQGNNAASWTVTYDGFTYTSGSKNGKWDVDETYGRFIQPNGSGSKTERVFTFTTNTNGTLTIFAYNPTKNSSRNVVVVDGSGTSQKAGITNPSDGTKYEELEFSVKAGNFYVYPEAGLRFFWFEFTEL